MRNCIIQCGCYSCAPWRRPRARPARLEPPPHSRHKPRSTLPACRPGLRATARTRRVALLGAGRQSPPRGVVRRGAWRPRPSHSSSPLDTMRIIACVLLLAATAFAGCSNSCSGHGTCSGNDKVSRASRRVGEGAPRCRSRRLRRPRPAQRLPPAQRPRTRLRSESGSGWWGAARRGGAGSAAGARRGGATEAARCVLTRVRRLCHALASLPSPPLHCAASPRARSAPATPARTPSATPRTT